MHDAEGLDLEAIEFMDVSDALLFHIEQCLLILIVIISHFEIIYI